jgi:hypothetical protein
MIQARWRIEGQLPPDYLNGLEELMWYGSLEAQRLAIPEICYFRHLGGFVPVLDAGYLHPELRRLVAERIVLFQSDRARFFLGHVLEVGTADDKRAAARSLAAIGDRAKQTLRDAVLSQDRETRMQAVFALLDVSEPEDVSLLHEYAAGRPQDDPALLERVRERALELEALIEDQAAALPEP